MCLVALALEHHPRFPLVLATNRDEFLDRATAPLGWWRTEDGTAILGGRDLAAGGTWLGMTVAGRLALVTNVRDPSRHDPAAPSRGRIVADWLRAADPTPRLLARALGAGHNGFNLLAFDFLRGERWFASNHGEQVQRLGPGLHGLSNASLDTPWPKVTALTARLQAALERADGVEPLAQALFAALRDPVAAPDAALPATGVPLERERELSPAFIRTRDGRYGTRSSTLVVTERVGAQHVTHVIERTYDAAGATSQERREALVDWPPRAAHDVAPEISVDAARPGAP